MLQLMDNYSATYGLVTIGICICLALGWVYGKLLFNSEISFETAGTFIGKSFEELNGLSYHSIYSVVSVMKIEQARAKNDITQPWRFPCIYQIHESRVEFTCVFVSLTRDI